MTFRIRVFALVAIVVLLAAGASTYLTFTLAENAVTASATAQQQLMRQIAEEVTRYGRDHGTWEGVAEVAAGIARRTGRRIRLDTQDGAVGVVDTAVLAGQPVTPMTKLTLPIDARPQLDLPQASGQEREITLQAIEEYRQEIRFAACLSRAGVAPQAVTTHYGLPLITHTTASPDLVAECRTGTASQPRSITRDKEEVGRCFDTPGEATAPGSPKASRSPDLDPAQHLRTCLREVFLTRIGIVGPEPLRLAVSSADGIDTTPIMLAFSVVAVPIVLGSLLLSRHVLRPIQRLTIATRRFGQGRLDQRVTVEGGDELAQLAVTFNGMADSLQHAEEQQRRMIADIAHELRTPLANVRAYLEALEDGLVSADETLFRSLHEETMLQQRIIDDLQTLALAEAGALAYDRSTVDLGELLDSCRAAHQPAAAAVAVDLAVTAGPALLVHADAGRLRQAVGNLVTNAVRHAPAGTTVTLAALRVGHDVQIQVTDRGRGIPPEDQRRVFQRFWRADRARTRATGGSGLGLTIARQITVDHGGTIGLVSEPGRGTTFAITLPAGDATPAAAGRGLSGVEKAPLPDV
ncbi:sensor histidine kinase [Catellatospora citrea]|uniref:histidine kinase n=1 Tax=Catellatospora citrea TaxID=53366 RepID=A0A8J3P3S8_9ACTN|nr:HAMP domain-containing sensor histidine kinase [Catellatospora citrea]RKE11955.1 two-component system sensor histidine kinase BaeS [Catellatospora citrea]GIG00386.1 two-component sensor histidine kinase [Catellatospora citrea]